MDLTFLQNRLVVAVIAAVLGAVLTFLIQRLLNKRGLFTYFVWHNRIGVSADDAVFGSVRVTWNNNPVANLYSSTVELRNESLNDYENVIVRVFTSDTVLLTERTEIVGTTHILEWNGPFAGKLAVPPGSQPTPAQMNIYTTQREYLIPTFNRGQLVRFTFFNAGKTEKQPSLWLDIVHKGVKIKFRVAHNKFMGVSQPSAAIVGSLLGFVLLGIVIAFVDTVWVAALISLIYGLLVLVPGALSIKLWRWFRDYFGG
jgi:hypothetical protein